MKFDVVGIDGPCVDLVLNVNEFPKANGGTRVQNCSWQGGGKVATGMVAAARLGAKGGILGHVGADNYGDFCIKDFERHGIDTKYLLRREEKTTNFSVIVSDKMTMGRSILFHPGTAPMITKEELPVDYIQNARYFFIAHLDQVTVQAVRIAREAGVKIVIDADSYIENLEEAIPLIDVFVGSEFLYNKLFDNMNYEENCRSIMERGPEIVVFTLGEKGCVGISKEGFFEHPAYHVEVVDTLGAGDVYHGAFIAGLLQGWSAKETALFSSAVSAVKCTRIGGRAGIPDMNTVIGFMKTGVVDYTEIDERVKFYQRGMENV